jgi:hypothetical protein
MNTYAKRYLESAKLDKTFWGKKIIAAEKRGGFTLSNSSRAATWVTCACGKITQDIPRNRRSRPLDAELIRLGNLFSTDVDTNDFLSTAYLLARIEKRAIYVAGSNTLTVK